MAFTESFFRTPDGNQYVRGSMGNLEIWHQGAGTIVVQRADVLEVLLEVAAEYGPELLDDLVSRLRARRRDY